MLLKRLLGKSKLLRYHTANLLKGYRIQLIASSAAHENFETKLAVQKNREIGIRIKPVIFSNFIVNRYGSSEGSLNKVTFESVCSETLESLAEYFEELVETIPQFKNGDVTYSDGVLTVNFGKSFGTYVINRQSPNLQIWLSSPVSGPKRYDFVNGTWVYRHDRTTLHTLLDNEICKIAEREVEFRKRCAYSKGGDS